MSSQNVLVLPSLAAALLLSMLPGACAAKESAAPKAGTTTAVHVCIDAQGHVAYQGMPCADGQRTRAVRNYSVPPVDPALTARTQGVEQEMDRRNRGGEVRLTTRAARPAKSTTDPCKAAKARRKAMLDRAGVKRGYAQLEEIDREVWTLCKGL
jgi:hypothetical protein